MNIKEKDSQYVAHTYARFPLEIVKGEGSLLWDDEGKEYHPTFAAEELKTLDRFHPKISDDEPGMIWRAAGGT